jgi:hypothetical protein
MTDDEFLSRFEACTLDPFHHRDHVRVAFLYLRRYPAPEAIARFSTALRNFAASKGKPTLYHETVTWAYLFLIRERMFKSQTRTWDEFAATNGDLLSWKENILKRYYRDETLASDDAKSVFLFPDKL